MRRPRKGGIQGTQFQFLHQFSQELLKCGRILKALFVTFLAAFFTTTPNLLV